MNVLPSPESERRPYIERSMLMFFPIVLLLGFTFKHYRYDYPRSSVFINASTNQYDQSLEQYLTPLITKDELDNSVSINLGDVPGYSMQSKALEYLSPIIRMNPQAPLFTMSWNSQDGNFFRHMELSYNRERGNVMLVTSERNAMSTTTLLARDVIDKDIHQGAQSRMGYDSWASNHWSNLGRGRP